MSNRPGVLAAGLSVALAGAAGAAPVVVPYGSWASPVSAADLARSAAGISDVRVFDGRIYWRESRPAEGGRQVLVTFGADGLPKVLTPGFST